MDTILLRKRKLRPAMRRSRRAPVRTTAPYALATGEAAAYRLRILHAVYEPGTRRALLAKVATDTGHLVIAKKEDPVPSNQQPQGNPSQTRGCARE